MDIVRSTEAPGTGGSTRASPINPSLRPSGRDRAGAATESQRLVDALGESAASRDRSPPEGLRARGSARRRALGFASTCFAVSRGPADRRALHPRASRCLKSPNGDWRLVIPPAGCPARSRRSVSARRAGVNRRPADDESWRTPPTYRQKVSPPPPSEISLSSHQASLRRSRGRHPSPLPSVWTSRVVRAPRRPLRRGTYGNVREGLVSLHTVPPTCSGLVGSRRRFQNVS